MFHRKKAFTLIELLVVIAIIGILATIVVVSFTNAQAKASDNKRKADIQAISSALEMYYVDHKTYPILGAVNYSRIRSVNLEVNSDGRWDKGLGGELNGYISMPLAQDPKQSFENYTAGSTTVPVSGNTTWRALDTEYFYTYMGSAKSYVLCAKLEVTQGNDYASFLNKTLINGAGGNIELNPADQLSSFVRPEKLYFIGNNLAN